jgi:rare lipoprotein A
LTRAAMGCLLAAAALLAGCAESTEDAWRPPPAYPQGATWAPPGSSSPGASWAPPPQASPQAPYQWGRASYYADRLAGHSTATGEPYDPRALTAAHRTLPLGTFVDVARADGRHVVVRVNDRGPFSHGRIIDLSRRAAADLGMIRDGTADVVLRVLWVPPARARRM